MTSPPDKLFRQGLEHYQKPAPGSAWERIESGLDRKKHKIPWFKIAATLLLMMVASFVLWQFNETDPSVATISKESSSGNLITDTISSVATDESRDKIRESAVVSPQSAVRSAAHTSTPLSARIPPIAKHLQRDSSQQFGAQHRSRQNHNVYSETAVSSQQSAVSSEKALTSNESQLAATTEPTEANMEPITLAQDNITTEISIADAALDSRRTSITYSAEEVNAKYLKKESTTQATPEKKNTSGLQKVIDLAIDLKNEGSVLGDIREKKNEWLSISMPSNKRETNK